MSFPVLRALLPALLLLATPRTEVLAAGAPLSRCQSRIAAAGEHLTNARRRVQAGCVAEALACSGALAGRAATNDACLARVARRCTAAAPALAGANARVDVAGPRCTIVGGISPDDLLGDEGLAFAGVSAFCPTRTVDQTSPVDLSRCQRETLVCTEDAALLTLAPRAATILAHLGMASNDGTACLAAHLCGNGEVDGDEACDDGPGNSDAAPDACRTTCVEPTCGDGILDADEECDDGNREADDGCAADCTIEAGVCGNGVVENGEACDDGNEEDGDGCASDCTLETDVCGNGTVEGEEDCDTGRQNSDALPDRCRKDCTDPSCGDGVVDPLASEQCEPPGTLVCDDDCQLRLPLPPPLGGVRTAGEADALARCQAGLLNLGTTLFAAERRLLDRCVLQIARCVIDVPPNDADGAKTDACLTRAQTRCDAVVERRDAIETRCADRMAGTCALPIDQLLEADGLGFTAVAEGCTYSGSDVPGVADLLDCVVARSRCLAEDATARTIPRAYDLLSELYDPDSEFPCVTDPLSIE